MSLLIRSLALLCMFGGACRLGRRDSGERDSGRVERGHHFISAVVASSQARRGAGRPSCCRAETRVEQKDSMKR